MRTDYREQFQEAIRAAGLTPPDVIEADGELHRFASNGKRDDDAWYYGFHGDGVPAGFFGCWRSGIKETWRADIGRKLSTVAVAALREREEANKRKREAERERQHAEADERATGRSRAPCISGAHPHNEHGTRACSSMNAPADSLRRRNIVVPDHVREVSP